MNVPEDRRYTDQHEWVLPAEGPARVGITDYAQDELGDIVHVRQEPGSDGADERQRQANAQQQRGPVGAAATFTGHLLGALAFVGGRDGV